MTLGCNSWVSAAGGFTNSVSHRLQPPEVKKDTLQKKESSIGIRVRSELMEGLWLWRLWVEDCGTEKCLLVWLFKIFGPSCASGIICFSKLEHCYPLTAIMEDPW